MSGGQLAEVVLSFSRVVIGERSLFWENESRLANWISLLKFIEKLAIGENRAHWKEEDDQAGRLQSEEAEDNKIEREKWGEHSNNLNYYHGTGRRAAQNQRHQKWRTIPQNELPSSARSVHCSAQPRALQTVLIRNAKNCEEKRSENVRIEIGIEEGS